jgi:aminopeptidase N
LYAGMENTTSTIFSEDFVVDELGFNDKNYVNVNAHELAHQWFGDLVTAKTGKHHWLQEGFATYYALLAEKNIFGEDYFYSKMYENWEEINNNSSLDTIPIMNEKASSTTFYKKGALALFVLQTELGDKNFKKAIKNYLKKYSYKSVETDDFLSEIKKVSKYDVEKFKKTFLETTRNDSLYLGYLKKWKQYQYIEQIDAVEYNSDKRNQVFATILGDLKIDPSIKMKIFHKLVNYTFEDKRQLLDIAFKDKRLEVQKGILRAISEYPEDYNGKMDSIFNLPSYSIKRDFLNNTTTSEVRRFKKLDEIEQISKNDLSLRLTWLQLAINYKDYQPNKKKEFIEELNNYTSSDYNIYTRIGVYNSLSALLPENKVSLENLFLATKHHNWQLVGSAKVFIESYLTNEGSRNLIIEFQKTTTPEIQQIIQKFLDKIKVGGRL